MIKLTYSEAEGGPVSAAQSSFSFCLFIYFAYCFILRIGLFNDLEKGACCFTDGGESATVV